MQNFQIKLKTTGSIIRCLSSTLGTLWKTDEKISKCFSTNISRISSPAATTKTPLLSLSSNSGDSYLYQQRSLLKSGGGICLHYPLQFDVNSRRVVCVNISCAREFSVSNKRQTNSVGFLVKQERSLASLEKKSSAGLKMAPTLAPTVKLNNGYEMPVLGLGTYESKNNEAEIAVKHAIDVGYRHIDTAYFYQNEAEIGKAICDKIAEGVVQREDIFLVTKLWNIHHEPARVEGACRKQLQLLGLDYIDLYLMHVPVGYQYINEETLLPKNEDGVLQLSDVDYVDTYKAMEELVNLGLVRSIGVSNFNSEQIQRLLDNCQIKPVTNQVECSPALNQKKLTKFCQEHGITLTAYSPLGRPKPSEKKPEFYYDEKTQALAQKHGKTPAQIILRYLVDIGTIPIPKSSNPQRIEENFNIFDFKLTPEDIAVMDSFNTGERLVPFNLIKGQNHKYWPFAIEF